MNTDIWTIIKMYGPLAAIAGGVYAVLRQIYAYAWRLAKVEERSERHEEVLDGLKAPLDAMGRSVVRIEAQLEDMRRRG